MSIKTGLKGLEYISRITGKYPDQVQGGGGNTSVKLDDQVMAVKASGFKLNQVNEKEGYVYLNYRNIVRYLQGLKLTEDRDFEEEFSLVVKENIISNEEEKGLKPSIEAGFHSLLRKYVIHTHSVYANIICCTEEGEDLLRKVFQAEGYQPLWLNYTPPGFYLTLALQEGISKYINKYGHKPEVIFLENHGLIVNNDDPEECVSINNQVNKLIRSYLKIEEGYPEIKLEKIAESEYRSTNSFLKDYFQDSQINEDFFQNIIYPDQVVYLGDDLVINKKGGRINIDTEKGEIVYSTNYHDAMTIDETLTAFLFIISNIKRANLTLKPLGLEYIRLIKGMKGEDYRKKIIKEMG
jgi:ribulose-5-phosphate 4-epimerase/fuculose-1-phosphate aldolase